LSLLEPSSDAGLVAEDLLEPVLHAMRFEAEIPAEPSSLRQGNDPVATILDAASRIQIPGKLVEAVQLDVAAHAALYRGEECRELFEAALVAWQEVGQPYDEALCRIRMAEACLRNRDRAEAATLISAARATAQQLGAAPLEAEIDLLAARAGLLAGGPGRGVLGRLTPRELEVLGLLAEGYTNAQIAAELFMSPKTASVHVSRILDKFGAANRTEAAAIARGAL
jgi:DNA-binding CsgD family transcriptional regulator